MNQQEQFKLYVDLTYDTCLLLIQLWDTRDMNNEMHHAPLIRKLVEIEKILMLLKNEMVADASNLG
jgi:hypothetical protein